MGNFSPGSQMHHSVKETPYQITKLLVVTEKECPCHHIMRDSHVATELKPAIANMLTATVRQQMVVI
jgi:hypothetical protein